MQIYAEVSPGELFDKLTILEIKIERIDDAVKLANVKKEYKILSKIRDEHVAASDTLSNGASTSALSRLVKQLKRVNETLWVIEDDIRDCERREDFGKIFVELARSVYIENDQRAVLKKKINTLLHSNLFEEKSYQAY